jgi:hypothetical protein
LRLATTLLRLTTPLLRLTTALLRLATIDFDHFDTRFYRHFDLDRVYRIPVDRGAQ